MTFNTFLVLFATLVMLSEPTVAPATTQHRIHARGYTWVAVTTVCIEDAQHCHTAEGQEYPDEGACIITEHAAMELLSGLQPDRRFLARIRCVKQYDA